MVSLESRGGLLSSDAMACPPPDVAFGFGAISTEARTQVHVSLSSKQETDAAVAVVP